MPVPEIENAVITEATIGFEGHAILTLLLSFKTPSGTRSIPMWNFDAENDMCLSTHVTKLLATIGVNSLDQLQGKPCRVRYVAGLIASVGNYIEDHWYTPEDLAEKATR